MVERTTVVITDEEMLLFLSTEFSFVVVASAAHVVSFSPQVFHL